jgi:succinyl-CoA synthetase beta subunit
MNLHEFQAKELFGKAQIPVPPQRVATDPEEAVQAARLFGFPVVLKAQVHAGGRGKAGGVKLARSIEEVSTRAAEILGLTIKGHPVRRLLISPAADIARELYAGVVLDRRLGTPVLMVSAAGGVDIEEVAAKEPEKILLHPLRELRLPAYRARELAFALEPRAPLALAIADMLMKLVDVAVSRDASLVEINPLAITETGQVVALDAKFVADDNALFRQEEVAAYRDIEEEGREENFARENDLSYIRLDGEIGCLVNGAGLAMATMDVIKHFGGTPANFLDIGGSSRPEKVIAAMEILGRDPNVKAVLINIFGGITRCDDVANGLVTALRAAPTSRPMVIRLTGTNEEAGRAILAQNLREVRVATTMDDAVKAVVALAAGS